MKKKTQTETGTEQSECNCDCDCKDSQIREKAYLKWEAAGKPQDADPTGFWLDAEKEVKQTN